jgi:hypothetical protein
MSKKGVTWNSVLEESVPPPEYDEYSFEEDTSMEELGPDEGGYVHKLCGVGLISLVE